MKQILYRIGNVLYWILAAGLTANILLGFWGIRPYIVTSGSMEPAIHTGSICWIKETKKPAELLKGEILAFYRNDKKMVVHRIEEKTEEGYVTKGDANDKPDTSVVAYKNVVGKVWFSVSHLGYFIMGITTKSVAAGSLSMVLMMMLFQKKLRSRELYEESKKNK